MTRVEAPSRLHFGLLSLPADGAERWPGFGDARGLPVRSFGGVGLMVDAPGVVVGVRLTTEWRAEGSGSARALQFAQKFVDGLPPAERRAFHILVERCPPEHTGLGTGTALGLAVARALAIELGHADWPVMELARRAGRGERSAVGIHGFERGGFIVEAGKLPGKAIAPLVCRHEFPDAWRILVIQPGEPAGWHGDRERRAFAQLRRDSDTGLTETLCRLVLLGMLPALACGDCDAFGEALYEFNARVGTVFAPVQGGIYGSPALAEMIAFLRAHGVQGAGQSSWGPTVFAVVPDVDRAIELARRVGERFTAARCLIAKANGEGARATLVT
jgi:beta-ribofuranosylaminobenzene 5'-phosphate synthase